VARITAVDGMAEMNAATVPAYSPSSIMRDMASLPGILLGFNDYNRESNQQEKK
jgi:hypothetical protein